MQKRVIHTLWITRKGIDAGYHPPELAGAWDDFSVEEHPEVWRDLCVAALEALGDDLAFHRYIDVTVSEDALDEAFSPARIDGEVTSADP